MRGSLSILVIMSIARQSFNLSFPFLYRATHTRATHENPKFDRKTGHYFIPVMLCTNHSIFLLLQQLYLQWVENK